MQSEVLANSTASWQSQLRDTISTPTELLQLLGLNAVDIGVSLQAGKEFPLKVPHSFARRMRYGDPHDPLLKQVLAIQQEILPTVGYTTDPVGESGATNPEPGVIQKYHGRVLLIVSAGCAINCRYCFRRHFPYAENQNSRQQWPQVLQYIEADRGIDEVILSGGDPLVATDELLLQLVEQIGTIAHVKRLRIHSRLPVVIPQRVTEGLLAAITHSRLQTVMVIHSNHANEINVEVADAIAAMRSHNITTLNQSVLLAGINDNVAAQVALSQRLFAAGVMPYYLHVLDKVAGAAHFDVPEGAALEIMAQMRARLPGYMVPKLVRELAGASAKIPV